MFCQYCGKPVPEGSAFCPACGQAVKPNPVSPPETPAAMETASYTVEPEAAPEAVSVSETAPEAVSEPETASQTPAEQSVPEAAPPPAESAAATAVPEAAPEQGTAALPEWPVPAPAAPPVKKSRLPLILGICAGAAALIAGVEIGRASCRERVCQYV